MKNLPITLLALFITIGVLAQEELTRPVSAFEKISVSPRINLVLLKGDQESVRIVYQNVNPNRINTVVYGNRLRIYLDGARVLDKRERVWDGSRRREPIYKDAAITVYVTYVMLKEVEMRGEEELICESTLEADKFKLIAFGRADIQLASVQTGKFKASLYGENKIKIKSGEANHQVYRLFGENKIDTRGLESSTASARIYGEGKLTLSAKEEVHIHSFGEPDIFIEGDPYVSKGIIIGRTTINHR
jgi:hypothetical protein